METNTETEQKWLTPKELAKEIWHPVIFDEPPAERTTSPLGPIVLADMEDAEEQWDAIVARVSPREGSAARGGPRLPQGSDV